MAADPNSFAEDPIWDSDVSFCTSIANSKLVACGDSPFSVLTLASLLIIIVATDDLRVLSQRGPNTALVTLAFESISSAAVGKFSFKCAAQ